MKKIVAIVELMKKKKNFNFFYFFIKLFRLNVEGEMSSSEHCFVSDKDMVMKKFCLDYQGIWNPVGEWKYEAVSYLS
jgi:hypothetical protein